MDDRPESEYERGTGSALSELRIEEREPMEAARDEWYRGGGSEPEERVE